MKVCHSIPEIRQQLGDIRNTSIIGFVPTMGALHQGHVSLVRASKENVNVTVASIFVNPTQFNKIEDLEKYPRTLERDLEQLNSAGCDFVFVPEAHEMYPGKPEIKIDLGPITGELEGKFRPGHFNGVGQVVSKLFNIIQPDIAFFGQKDLQQFYVIQKMIDELNFPVQLQMVSTQREANGLAMSSRNMRLSEDDQEHASLLFRSLLEAKELLKTSNDVKQAKSMVRELFDNSNRLELEYFEVVQTTDFKPLNTVIEQDKTALCIAAEIGGVRLIDNLLLNS